MTNASQSQLKPRFKETYLLTQMLEEEREKATQVAAQLEKAQQRVDVLEKSIDELLHSRSWRITGPVRSFLGAIRNQQ